MTPTPDWVSMLAPFLSGAIGTGSGAAIVYYVLKARLDVEEVKRADLDRRVTKNEQKLDSQVGQSRCDKMHEECKKEFGKQFDDVEKRVDSVQRDMVGLAVQVARVEKSRE